MRHSTHSSTRFFNKKHTRDIVFVALFSIIFSIFVGTSSVTASENGNNGTETGSGQQQTETGGSLTPSTDFQERYQTLAGALKGQNPEMANQLNSGNLHSDFGQSIGFDSLSDSFTINTAEFSDLGTYVSTFFSQGGLDGKVAGSAAMYANQLGTLHAGELAPEVLPDQSRELPEESMLFGLVFNQSLTGILGDTNVLQGVQSGELGNGAIKVEWANSINDAAERVEGNLGDKILSPCYGSFLGALGGGADTVTRYGFSEECEPCIVGGLYLNSEMNRLLDPTYDAQYYDPDDNVLTPAEYVQVPAWLKDPVAAYDPVRAPQLEGVRTRTANGQMLEDCNASATAGKATLDQLMDSIVGNLATSGH